MFEKYKERNRQRAEELERQIRAEQEALCSMTEKELLVELLLEVKRLNNRLNDIE